MTGMPSSESASPGKNRIDRMLRLCLPFYHVQAELCSSKETLAALETKLEVNKCAKRLRATCTE